MYQGCGGESGQFLSCFWEDEESCLPEQSIVNAYQVKCVQGSSAWLYTLWL